VFQCNRSAAPAASVADKKYSEISMLKTHGMWRAAGTSVTDEPGLPMSL